MEAPPGFEPGIEVLQPGSALLGGPFASTSYRDCSEEWRVSPYEEYDVYVESSGDGDKKGTAEPTDDTADERERLAALVERERQILEKLINDAKSKGADVWLGEWTKRFLSALPPGAKVDFLELCESDDCDPIALAVLTAFLQYSPRLQTIMRAIAGEASAEDRSSAARKLEK
ncbi:MAG TPA: hypothetical protein VFU28_15930, partial [Vicinamibacterales bacterium]|nr:hypothetical protein [Vicinamibacterales bacterium]